MRELGAAIAADYAGREPLLVAPLKSSAVFLADLSRALPILHAIDVIELAGYADGRRGGVRLLKDLETPIVGRDVLLVEDVVDTGLTLAYLTRTLAERSPASIAAVTLLNRPYRRLVENIGLHYGGFTVPDELRLLRDAAQFQWSQVQPSIFGSLLEGDLGHDQQWRLGAHYTYEADIQKVVQPTIVQP